MKEKILKFKAVRLLDNERVDSFLSDQEVPSDIKDFWTRSYIKRLIGKGAVKLNGQYVEKPSHLVRDEDEVEVIIVPDATSSEVLLPEDIPLDIEYEDDTYLYINKPSGMVVHPGAGNPTGTLANGLLHYLNKQNVSLEGEEFSRKVGLAHRLDKDTSGVILVVKEPGVLRRVMQKFEYREIDKYYLAVVYDENYKESLLKEKLEAGDLKEITNMSELEKYLADLGEAVEWNEIDTYLSRHPENRRKMIVSEGSGRRSVTEWGILGRVSLKPMYRGELEKIRLGNLYLVLVKPVTGRIHQIRVHLKSIGLPVLGDPLYGKGHEVFNFMFLHSFALSFDARDIKNDGKTTKTRQSFLAKFPQNWENSIEKIEAL